MTWYNNILARLPGRIAVKKGGNTVSTIKADWRKGIGDEIVVQMPDGTLDSIKADWRKSRYSRINAPKCLIAAGAAVTAILAINYFLGKAEMPTHAGIPSSYSATGPAPIVRKSIPETAAVLGPKAERPLMEEESKEQSEREKEAYGPKDLENRLDLAKIAKDVYKNGNNGLEDTLDENDTKKIREYLQNRPEDAVRFLLQKWHNSYKSRSHKGSIRVSINRSRKYIGYLKHVFTQRGVPQEYAFLAIPESHCHLTAISRAGGRGYYQWLEQYANSFELKTKGGTYLRKGKERWAHVYDERVNPILSADATARYLKKNRGLFEDWDLTLASYNSGKPQNEFYNRTEESGESRNYANYLKYLGEKAGRIQEKYKGKKSLRRKFIGFIKENLNYPPKFRAVVEILKNDYPDYYNTKADGRFSIKTESYEPTFHRVRRGETLYGLSKQYGFTVSVIKRANGLGKQLYAGKLLRIPGISRTIDGLCDKYQMDREEFLFWNPHLGYTERLYKRHANLACIDPLPEKFHLVLPTLGTAQGH
jgi:LysM repeat protein